MRYPNRFIYYFDHLLELGRFLGIGMVFLSMVLLCAHVAMRYIFNYPLNWVIDVSTIFIFLITFLGAPWLLREEGHVSLDMLKNVFSRKVWGRLQCSNSIICAIFCAIISVYGVKETVITYRMDLVWDMPLAPPKWPFILVVPVGTILMAIQFLRRAQVFWRRATLEKDHHGKTEMENRHHAPKKAD